MVRTIEAEAEDGQSNERRIAPQVTPRRELALCESWGSLHWSWRAAAAGIEMPREEMGCKRPTSCHPQ
jgi:hypothetical protein